MFSPELSLTFTGPSRPCVIPRGLLGTARQRPQGVLRVLARAHRHVSPREFHLVTAWVCPFLIGSLFLLLGPGRLHSRCGDRRHGIKESYLGLCIVQYTKIPVCSINTTKMCAAREGEKGWRLLRKLGGVHSTIDAPLANGPTVPACPGLS